MYIANNWLFVNDVYPDEENKQTFGLEKNSSRFLRSNVRKKTWNKTECELEVRFIMADNRTRWVQQCEQSLIAQTLSHAPHWDQQAIRVLTQLNSGMLYEAKTRPPLGTKRPTPQLYWYKKQQQKQRNGRWTVIDSD